MSPHHRYLLLLILGSACLGRAAWAEETEGVWCRALPPESVAQHPDCLQSGPAPGELLPEWRQKLPPTVRWLTRADALKTCSEGSLPEAGRVVATVGRRGCVWLSSQSCTILTDAYLSHAEIGMAVRHCAAP